MLIIKSRAMGKEKMAVLIENQQIIYPISSRTLERKAQLILNALDCPDGELSLLIVDDLQIAEFNKKYLDREGPTNVIAFAMREGRFSHISPELLGDVVISIETAAQEGKNAGISLRQRFDQLLVHGILHLFGYDHVNDPDQAAIMEKKSDFLMKIIMSANAC